MKQSSETASPEQHRQDTARQTLQQISESDHDYERFLMEQTHQLKKLFQSIKVHPRRRSEVANLEARSFHCPFRNCDAVKGRIIQTIELADLQPNPIAMQTLRSVRGPSTDQSFRRSVPSRSSNNSRRLMPPLDFYREKRTQIERSLFIGGKGYEVFREGTPTLSTATDGKRLHEFRDSPSRLKQSFRRYTRERYRNTPSR